MGPAWPKSPYEIFSGIQGFYFLALTPPDSVPKEATTKRNLGFRQAFAHRRERAVPLAEEIYHSPAERVLSACGLKLEFRLETSDRQGIHGLCY